MTTALQKARYDDRVAIKAHQWVKKMTYNGKAKV